MNKNLKHYLEDVENLYVGWIYNPIIDIWNGFADYHDARVDARRAARNGELPPEDDRWFATVDGKEYPIRPLRFKEDFAKIWKVVEKSQKRDDKKRVLKNRASKRKKHL